MDFLDRKAREKIGFNFVLDNISIYSVFGRELIKILEPVKNRESLLQEYNNVDKFISIIKSEKLFCRITHNLQSYKDIRNSFKKINKDEILDEVELFEVKSWVILFEELKSLYNEAGINIEEIVFSDFSEVFALLNPEKAKTTTFCLYDDYSEKLKNIRESKRQIEKSIYKEKDNREKLLEERRLIVNEEKEEELLVRKNITIKLKPFSCSLLESAALIGKIDMLLTKAKMAVDFKLCKPVISKDIKLKITDGINPLVEKEVTKEGGRFSPVSIELYSGASIITGANMGGKTVALSITALNYLLASMGFYVFAQYFEFYPLEFVSFLSEEGQSLSNGLSTFGSEVVELKKILEKLKKGTGLVILDEFARGTNPAEGSRLTKALVEYLNKFSSICVLSTHYDGVAKHAKQHYQVRGLKNVDFNALKKETKEEKDFLALINRLMDYTLEKVDSSEAVPRDAAKICSLLGIDEEIVNSLSVEN